MSAQSYGLHKLEWDDAWSENQKSLFIVCHQCNVGRLVNRFGQEISVPTLGTAQQALQGGGPYGP
uniref:Uncharacterized protein n=1 Tax=Romanomermis culicivorax TaxID=13658 RepID=A0A915J2H5_ROMCU